MYTKNRKSLLRLIIYEINAAKYPARSHRNGIFIYEFKWIGVASRLGTLVYLKATSFISFLSFLSFFFLMEFHHARQALFPR